MGVGHIEYHAHKTCIEIATQSTTVYKVGMAPTKYRAHEACIEIARTTAVYRMGDIGCGIV